MAFKQVNATVGTTASLIFTCPAGPQQTSLVTVSNGHTSSVFLGAAADVTVSGQKHGLTLAAGASVQFYLQAGDQIWAIASIASGTGDITILTSGN